MTRTHEGSGGDGYGGTQQEAAPFRLAVASYLEVQIDPFHSPLVRLGWMATNTLGMSGTCPQVARCRTGCRRLGSRRRPISGQPQMGSRTEQAVAPRVATMLDALDKTLSWLDQQP